jgi:hypothetical protein
MHLKLANNSHLNPSMHSGFRRREEAIYPENFPAGGERLHTKQPKGPARIGRKGGIPTDKCSHERSL